MKYFVFAIRDRAADVYGQPHFGLSIGSAIRGFGDEVNNPREGNAFYKHPEDFDLFHLGYYYDENGKFDQLPDGPKQIAVGKDMVINK